ncbi:ABC transporter permease, partial [Dactylosporangium sp. NPDC005572]|uniref:ABC transporter permease n=1 Tax=Dactylosporangium sp. NPDC005572 TaxID=3156889 RepID=UPI0033A6C1CB
MLRLVFGALLRRRAQGLAVLVLTVLLCAVAAAGPLYTAAAGSRVAAADLAEAPPAQRLLSVHRAAPTGDDPAAALTAFRREVEALLTAAATTDGATTADPGGTTAAVLGMTQALTSDTGGFGRKVPVAYRDGACPHLRLDGDCPARPGEAALSTHAANTLGVRAGDELVLRSQPGAPKVHLKVTAIYERQDPGGTWWADPLFGPGHIVAGEETLDPVFVPVETFAGDVLDGPTAVYTVPVPTSLIDRLGVVNTALREAGFDTEAPGDELLDRVAADRAATRDGVLAGWVEALTLCLLALGIVGRHTAQDRRPDVALLKLRGSTRRRMLRLVLWQHLLPVAVALPAGLLLGWAVARLAAGPSATAGAAGGPGQLPASAAAAGIAAVAGLVVLVLVEVPLLRTPVAELLRRSAGPARRWTGALLDVLLVALAAAALTQARSGSVQGVGLVAPVLAALAVAGLLARLVTALAGQTGRAALRTGRLPLAMAALQYHRRPGIDRIFALVAVAVALLGLAASGYAAAGRERAERTAAELGADRVLTVRAANQRVLLSAVRAADPGGKDAMAVALDRDAVPPVLAVDTARFAAVTGHALPHLPVEADDPPAVGGTALTVRAVNDSAGPLRLVVQLVHATIGT